MRRTPAAGRASPTRPTRRWRRAASVRRRRRLTVVSQGGPFGTENRAGRQGASGRRRLPSFGFPTDNP